MNCAGFALNRGSGTDAFGFSVLPAGYAKKGVVFSDVGFNARFWSSSGYRSDQAYCMYFNNVDENVRVDSSVYSEKSQFFSVRCLRDSVEGSEATSSSSSAQPTSSASSSNEKISSSSTTIVDLSSSSESITATFSMASANFNVQV